MSKHCVCTVAFLLALVGCATPASDAGSSDTSKAEEATVSAAEDIAQRSTGGSAGLELEYLSMVDIVAASDTVVAGTVRDLQPAHSVGEAEEEAVLKNHALLDVETIIHGDPRFFADGQTILIQESDYGGGLNGTPSLAAGDHVVMMLKALCEPGELPVYYRINSQGVYYFTESGEALQTARQDGLATAVANIPRDAVQERVREAAANRGNAQPPQGPPLAPANARNAEVETAESAVTINPGCTSTPFQ